MYDFRVDLAAKRVLINRPFEVRGLNPDGRFLRIDDPVRLVTENPLDNFRGICGEYYLKDLK